MKTKLTIISLLIFGSISAQSLDDFYDKYFEIYTPFSGISTSYSYVDSMGLDQKINYWGVLNLGGNFSTTKRWGISGSFSERLMGDLFFVLRGLISDDPDKDFTNVFYLSDFGFIPNFRLGINVIGQDQHVLNIGINHGYYVTNTSFITNGNFGDNSNDWISVGPCVNYDRAINSWLAARISTGPLFSYANGDKIKDNVPSISEHKLEVFTKHGFFLGLDYVKLSKFHDDKDDNIKIKRYDLKAGIRVKL